VRSGVTYDEVHAVDDFLLTISYLGILSQEEYTKLNLYLFERYKRRKHERATTR